MIDKRFAELMRDYRKFYRITQQQLANEAGLTRATIMHIERGTQKIYLEQAIKIAIALGILTVESKPLKGEG